MNKPKNFSDIQRNNKFTIEYLPITSNNYKHYKLSTDILGVDNSYLSDYYPILVEMKK